MLHDVKVSVRLPKKTKVSIHREARRRRVSYGHVIREALKVKFAEKAADS